MRKHWRLLGILPGLVTLTLWATGYPQKSDSQTLNTDVPRKDILEYRAGFSRTNMVEEDALLQFLEVTYDQGTRYDRRVIFVDEDEDYTITNLFGGFPVDIRETPNP